MASPVEHTESITTLGGELLALANQFASEHPALPSEEDVERFGELLDLVRYDVDSLETIWRGWAADRP